MQMNKISRSTLLAGLAMTLVAAGPASAQLAQNSDAPVDISADQLEVVNTQCLATYRGAAEAMQDTARLRAEVLKIFYKTRQKPTGPQTSAAQAAGATGAMGGKCDSQLDRMEAIGSVYYVTPQQRVRGDSAVYEAGSDTLTLTGDVIAIQGQNVLRGSKLVIRISTGDAQMQSGGKGKGGRVRTVIYPNQQPAGAAAAPR
ncbi:MAG: organic solvent tolerance protein OstA [Alphaproteobacteria bacterium PA2]|nr:MAG: organic solvent tolerance protein OstA [Alphaproteobacteria bacterium PA2]